MDCGYRLVEGDVDAGLLTTLHVSSAPSASAPNAAPPAAPASDLPTVLAVISVSDLEAFVNTGVSLPGDRLVVMPTERENPGLAAAGSELGALRYVLGTATPGLLRGLVASVLDHALAAGRGGVAGRLLTGDALETRTWTLTQSSERPALQEQVTAFFAGQLDKHKGQFVSGTGSFPKNIGDVLDEFLMNAIWDACPDRAGADRTQPACLAEGESVTVEVACDGTNLLLVVEDSYGSFPPSAMAKPVRHALGLRPPAQINEGPGGAGLGLHMILQKVSCLAYEVVPGTRTRALALLRGDQSLRELQKRPRSVMFFHG